MITKLTKAQIDRFPEYVDRYVKIGLCTDRVDHLAARATARDIYEAILARKHPRAVIVLGSPLSAWIGVCLLDKSTESQVWSQFESQVRSQVWSQVWSQVESQVWPQVESQVESQFESQFESQVRLQVWSQVRSQVESQVWSQVRSQVESQVRSQVESQVWPQVESQVESFIWPYLSGHFWASWFGQIDFYRDVLGVTGYTDKYAILRRSADFGLFYPLNEWCVISDRPQAIFRNSRGLHRDGGPALLYPDGWSIWALNGVRVPQSLAESPAEAIDPHLILSEQNAEVRREIVRKIGVERVLWKLGSKQLSKDGNYELHEVNIGNERKATALKMLNPSVPELWHVEFVAPTCRTVQEALNFRNGLSPEQIDDENGADFFQQGDVLMKPKGAKKFKSRPAILT